MLTITEFKPYEYRRYSQAQAYYRYEGIILSLVEWVQDELGENEIKIWKVFWYKHPYEEDPPHAGQYSESSLRIV